MENPLFALNLVLSMLRVRLLPSLALLLAVSSPFGLAQEPPAPPPTDDPLSQEILRMATESTTPTRQGRAIRQAATIGRTDLAGALLQGLAASVDEAGLAEAGREIGSLWLLRLRTSEELTDDQREIVARVQQSVVRAATDPAAIDARIEQLKGDAEQRREAVVQLRLGGDATAARLVTSLLAEPPEDTTDPRVDVLRRFGDAAAPALEQALLYGDPAAGPVLLEVLAAVAGREAIPFALAAYYSPVTTAALRETAARVLASLLGGVPIRDEAEQFLAGRLRHALGMLQQARNAPGASRSAWYFVEDPMAVAFRPATEPIGFASRAAAAAERLRLFGPTDDEVTLDAIAADVGYRLQADPLFGSAEDLAAADARWQLTGGVTPARLEQLVDPRLAPGAAPLSPFAQIAAIRLLGASGRPEVVDAAGPVPAPLVEAAIAGASDEVRWEAAAAIAELDPQRTFLGAAGVLQLWRQIAAAPVQPRALIVENLGSARNRGILWLESLGYDAVPAGSGRAAIDAFDDTAGFEVVLIGPDPVDMSVVELLDRMRRRPGGSRVPILLYNTPPETAPPDRWDAPLAAAAQVESNQALALRIRELLEQQPRYPLSPADRNSAQTRVSAMLDRIAEHPHRYPAFSTGEHSVTIPPTVMAPTGRAEQ